jgi:hypothetical protein
MSAMLSRKAGWSEVRMCGEQHRVFQIDLDDNNDCSRVKRFTEVFKNDYFISSAVSHEIELWSLLRSRERRLPLPDGIGLVRPLCSVIRTICLTVRSTLTDASTVSHWSLSTLRLSNTEFDEWSMVIYADIEHIAGQKN